MTLDHLEAAIQNWNHTLKKKKKYSKWTKERQNESVFILTSIILLRSSVTIASRKQES